MTSSKEVIIAVIAKQGAWAIVACSVLTYFGWQVNKLLDGSGRAVTTYVQSSSANITELGDTVKIVAENHLRLQELVRISNESLLLNQSMIETNGISIKLAQDNLTRVITLMETAQNLMRDVPEQRQRQIQLMEDLLELTKASKE